MFNFSTRLLRVILSYWYNQIEKEGMEKAVTFCAKMFLGNLTAKSVQLRYFLTKCFPENKHNV